MGFWLAVTHQMTGLRHLVQTPGPVGRAGTGFGYGIAGRVLSGQVPVGPGR